MAGSTRTAADPHDAAYNLGLRGKPLTSSLLGQAESDDSILDSWREGKADRPGDQPDSTEDTSSEDEETREEPRPKARRQPTPRSAPSRTRRAPPSSRSRPGRPTLADPTGGRLPIGFDGDGLAGAFFGAILYALIVSVADYGTAGPGYWFKAKFLNQPAPAKK